MLTTILALSAIAGERSIDMSAMQRHVYFLSDPKLEGRLTGSAGERIATDYCADYFKSIGALPGGVAGTYFQEFPASFGTAKGESAKLSFTLADGTPITPADDEWQVVYGSVESQEVAGGIVFAGEGVVNATRDDFRGLSVESKWVVMFPAAPRENPSNAVRAKNAEDRGAKGVIFAGPSQEGGHRVMRLSRQRGIGRDSKLAAVAVSPSIFTKLTGLDYDEARKSARDARVLTPTSPAKGISATVAFQPNRVTGRNVIAVLPGTDPNLRNQHIVIGAHIDHLGWGDVGAIGGTEFIHHGADDNASGTAMVLELAKYYAESKSNRRTLVFQLYSGEELGLIGSTFFTRNPTIPMASVAMMLNLDMVGYYSTGKLEISGVGSSPSWPALIEQVKTSVEVKVVEAIRPDSDHWPFANQGVPVLFFHTGLHGRYHRESDVAEHIDYEGMVTVGNKAIKLIDLVDAMSEMPPFKKGAVITERRAPGGETRERDMGRRVRVGLIPEYGDGGPGLLLSGVAENSPAERAGLRAGDRIRKWGTQTIGSIEDIQEIFLNAEAGKPVEVVIQRDGKEIKVTVTPEQIGIPAAA